MKKEELTQNIEQVLEGLKNMVTDQGLLKTILKAADLISRAMERGNKLMICGNGGSAADAQHMAGELVCRFYKDRKPLSAMALSTDTSVLTAISNDYSYGDIFKRQIQAHAKKGDVLLGISTSGNSKNVRAAFEEARKRGMKTILLTGKKGTTMSALSDIAIKVPSSDTPRIQEMHLVIEHSICEAVERRTCG